MHSFLIDKAIKQNPLMYLRGLNDKQADYNDFLEAFSLYGQFFFVTPEQIVIRHGEIAFSALTQEEQLETLNSTADEDMVEDNFYLIQNGDYDVTITNFHTSKHIGQKDHQDLIRTLKNNDYFGEVALLTGSQRSTQVTSTNYGCLTALPG